MIIQEVAPVSNDLPGLKSQSISALNQHISSVKTSFSAETLHLQNILSFFIYSSSSL